MPVLFLKGFARDIKYTATLHPELLHYQLEDFDVNAAAPYGLLDIEDTENSMGFSVWSTPKRTRTYPFARTYNIFYLNTKRIAIIPVIKDEGGDSQNNDRINFITFSWMNLLNVYIILAWYERADKIAGEKALITNQKLNAHYVREKLVELSHYHTSALHWNTTHFEENFQRVYLNAVESYERISSELGVRLHPTRGHLRALNRWTIDGDFSLEAFKNATLPRSLAAAWRETSFTHLGEYVWDGYKAIFEISNYLGGAYYLTADEILVEGEHITIQECKNARDTRLPSEDDIKDGLFKLILFSNLERLVIDEKEVAFDVWLKLTGKQIIGSLMLPAYSASIEKFCSLNQLRDTHGKLIERLNHEVLANPKLTVLIGGRNETTA